MESGAECYDSEGNYTSLVWDKPAVHKVSLLEMVSATKDTRVAIEDDPVMLTDSGELNEESRRGESRSDEPT